MDSLYGINVVLVPLNATSQAVEQLQLDKNAGNYHNGQVDLIWINGEDFYTAMSENLLYGPWATKLPNSANFDFNNPAIKTDFGEPTGGFEMPYNAAQIVFAINPTACPGMQVSDVSDMGALYSWVLAHPGKFTYANPANFSGDYTGSAFIRQFLYYYSPGGYSQVTYS